MLHAHKKSINVKDYIQNQRTTPTIQLQQETIQTTRSQNTKQQSSRYLSQKWTNQQNKQHQFLSKIRASNHKNRYRNCSGSYGGSESQNQSKSQGQRNNIQILNNDINRGGKQDDNDILWGKQDKDGIKDNDKDDKIIIKINRITAYSPFGHQEPDSTDKNGIATHYSYLFDKQSSKKIMNSLPKQTKYAYLLKKNKIKTNNDHSLEVRNKSNTDSIKNCAKIIELKTNFNTTKIFEQYREQLQGQIKQSLKLSPYQIATKRKNINLIKLKLNSLGEHADEQQKSNYQKLHKLFQQNDMNIQIQAEMKQKCHKIRQIRIKKQNNRYQEQHSKSRIKYMSLNHDTELNDNWSRSVTEHQPQLSLISKSIYIKQMQAGSQKYSKLVNRKNKSFSIQSTQSKNKNQDYDINRSKNRYRHSNKLDEIMPENQPIYATIDA